LAVNQLVVGSNPTWGVYFNELTILPVFIFF
jgi:hypothetical protein